jgi:hypothetical protein
LTSAFSRKIDNGAAMVVIHNWRIGASDEFEEKRFYAQLARM